MEQNEKTVDPHAEDRKLFAQACREATVRRYGRELTPAELAERFKQAEEPAIDVAGIELTPGNPNHCEGRTLDICAQCPHYRSVCVKPHEPPAYPDDPCRVAFRSAGKQTQEE